MESDAGADFFAEGMIRPEALVKLGAELAAAGADQVEVVGVDR